MTIFIKLLLFCLPGGHCSKEVIVARGNAREHENARHSKPLHPHGCTCESQSAALRPPQRRPAWKRPVEAQRKRLVCSSSTQTSDFSQQESNVPPSLSVFLMNVRDYDKLFKAVIYFCCICYIHTVDLRIYTSDKHFVRSQFILIVPLCQRLLMIFYRSLHSRFFFLRRRSVTDQAAFNLWELVVTQPVLKLSEGCCVSANVPPASHEIPFKVSRAR